MDSLHRTTFIRPMLRLPVALAVLIFAGCAAVGPDYVPPGTSAPAIWHTGLKGGLSAEETDPQILAAWWTTLDDPELSSLIDRAVSGNLDLKKARARVREARGRRNIAKAGFLPTLDAAGSASWSRTSKDTGSGKTSDLYNGGFDAGWEIDIFGGVRRSVEAAVSQAQATLEANETDLSKSVIRSPINGVVLTRSVEPGQTVAASFTAPVLFTLAEDLTQMELHVNVDEADIGKVHEGQKAAFSVSAHPNRTFEAQITQTRYGSSTTSGVVTYETVLKVNNSDLSLRPGMTATADITVKKVENAILIPSAALRFTPPLQEEKEPSTGLVGALLPRPPKPGSQQHQDARANKKQQRVWTLKDGQLSAIPVTIESTDGTMTEVVTGDIRPGMVLVVDTVRAVR